MTDTVKVLQSANTLEVILRMWEYESEIKWNGSIGKENGQRKEEQKKDGHLSSFIFAFSVFSYMLEHVQRAYVPMSLHVFMC